MSTVTKKPLPKTLKALVGEHIPTSIRNEKEYDKALKLIGRLLQIPKLTKGQAVYLNTLSDLIHCYEQEHHRIDPSGTTGLDVLKFLMEEHQMSASDLGGLLNTSAGQGSRILNGQRSLTLEHIKILGKHFRISPDVFMD
ncbi:MAG: helix-turn-helix domain-containing protein [Planctomycetaceae bacterium]|nr:helix-turn-helix domain-containing protein [Planctomycetaceae bacterium]